MPEHDEYIKAAQDLLAALKEVYLAEESEEDGEAIAVIAKAFADFQVEHNKC